MTTRSIKVLIVASTILLGALAIPSALVLTQPAAAQPTPPDKVVGYTGVVYPRTGGGSDTYTLVLFQRPDGSLRQCAFNSSGVLMTCLALK